MYPGPGTVGECDATTADRLLLTHPARFKIPEQSIPKEAAYQIINDELMLDGNPRLNLASFVTTWMEPECDKLIQSSINKNYVDMDEYPVTTELQVRVCLCWLLPGSHIDRSVGRSI
jgi:glutamate decarboxylase